MVAANVLVRLFEPSDQNAARALVLEGMREHWGAAFDPAFNGDLDDIAASYGDGVFVVAEVDGAVVGTGALKLCPDATGEVVRMSVDRRWRRRGVASAVVAFLIDEARARGCRRVALSTHSDWEDARAFYAAMGFGEVGRSGGGVSFERLL